VGACAVKALATLLAVALGSSLVAAEARVVVRLDRAAGRASPLLYGCSLPGPGAPGAPVLLAGLLRNGSFETPSPPKPLRMPRAWGEPRGWQLLSCGPRRLLVRNDQKADEPLILAAQERWGDYRFSLLARKIKGPGGLKILFEVQDARHHVRWTLGAKGNRFHILESVRDGSPRALAPPVAGRLEPGRCYRIDMDLREEVLRCSIDGRLIHRVADARFPHAGLGLGATDAEAEFFDITAHQPKGELVFLFDNPAEASREGLAHDWELARDPQNDVACERDFIAPFNSHFSQRIKVTAYAGGDAGIRQRGVPVRAGVTYRGRVHLRCQGKAPATVSLRGEAGQVYARAELGEPTEGWKAYDFALKPDVSDPRAAFYITIGGVASVWVDQVSLHASAPPTPFALRSDVVDALNALRPTVLRWPAGAAASDLNWTRGIGPPDERPAVPVAGGSAGAFEAAPGDFGTDEFLSLCRHVGAAPMLVVNPHLGAGSALQWLEYCNGAATTAMGKLRAANGHAEPYGVKHWLIGADAQAEAKPEAYARRAAEIARALHEADPSLRVIAFAGHGLHPDDRDKKLIEEAGPHISHVARATSLCLRPEKPLTGVPLVADLQAYLESLRGRSHAVALTDWSPSPSCPEPLLTLAAGLSALAAEAGREAIATVPCVARPVEGQLTPSLIDPATVPAATTPSYEVFRLLSSHDVGDRVSVELGEAGRPGPQAPARLSAAAGRRGDGIVVRLVHTGDAELGARVALEGLGGRRVAAAGEHFHLEAGKAPGAGKVAREGLAVTGNGFSLAMRPHSVHVVTLKLEGESK